MKEDILKKQLSTILPNRPVSLEPNESIEDRALTQQAQKLAAQQDAKELARIRFSEKQKLKRMGQKAETAKAIAEEYGLAEIPEANTENQLRKIAEQKKKIETIEAIEVATAEPLNIRSLAQKGALNAAEVNRALQLQGTSRPEILKLLTELNINLSIQLTKQDTANLLACLLTCNETQLAALYSNPKIPIAIKIIIRRLLEDMKHGAIETIEKLWDRVFGKGPMQLSLPEQAQLETGIIPNTPISREAYIVIRDTLIK